MDHNTFHGLDSLGKAVALDQWEPIKNRLPGVAKGAMGSLYGTLNYFLSAERYHLSYAFECMGYGWPDSCRHMLELAWDWCRFFSGANGVIYSSNVYSYPLDTIGITRIFDIAGDYVASGGSVVFPANLIHTNLSNDPQVQASLEASGAIVASWVPRPGAGEFDCDWDGADHQCPSLRVDLGVPHKEPNNLNGWNSVVTPIVAGTIALMKQVRPGITNAEIREILSNHFENDEQPMITIVPSAVMDPPPVDLNPYEVPVLNACCAVWMAKTGGGCCQDCSHHYSYDTDNQGNPLVQFRPDLSGIIDNYPGDNDHGEIKDCTVPLMGDGGDCTVEGDYCKIWAPNGGVAWAVFELDRNYTIEKLGFQWDWEGDLYIEFSEDGVSWNQVHYGRTNWTSPCRYSALEFNPPQNARFIKFRIHEGQLIGDVIRLAWFEWDEVPPCPLD